MLLLLFLTIFIHSDENDVTPVPVTAELKKGSKVQEVTNTLLYTMQLTNFTVYTNINGVNTIITTEGNHVVYIPTILRYLKVVDDVPNRTITITPDATQKLKSAILKPGILVGVTFAILFLIGVIYTSLCRKPQAARRPKPVNKSKRGIQDDGFDKAKSKRASVQARSASGNRSSNARQSTRSGSVNSHASSNGGSRGGSRSGSVSRGGSRGGTRSTRGRTTSRL